MRVLIRHGPLRVVPEKGLADSVGYLVREVFAECVPQRVWGDVPRDLRPGGGASQACREVGTAFRSQFVVEDVPLGVYPFLLPEWILEDFEQLVWPCRPSTPASMT